ncbi:MAG: response regulator [Myxococcota bacterium]|nr:response regulator [Myxococcota bacterium]
MAALERGVAAPPSDPPPDDASGTMRRRARVLVVDDDVLVAESLRRVLSDEFTVSAVTMPQAALDRLAGGDSFDVILCDVMMPVMNGIELRQRVLAVVPEQAARMVFITGGILVPQVRALLESVPNAWLEKPIDLEGLRELIRRRIRGVPCQTASGGV